MKGAMIYDDYIKLRDAKVGDIVELSTGETITVDRKFGSIGTHVTKPTKNSNLDIYDHTYIG